MNHPLWQRRQPFIQAVQRVYLLFADNLFLTDTSHLQGFFRALTEVLAVWLHY